MKQTPGDKRIPVKVSLIGTYDVGKSSLVTKFVRDKFEKDTESTIGGLFAAKNVSTVTGETVLLQIWDTAGSEKFKSLIPTYLRGSHVVLICYDNRNESLETVLKGIKTVEQYVPSAKIFLVRTKNDLGHFLVDNEILDYANREGYKIFQTSSLTGFGVTDLFERVAITGLALKKSEVGDSSLNSTGTIREVYPPIPDGYIARAGEACCIIM